MRMLTQALAVTLTLGLPAAANAAFILEASLGKGMQVSPERDENLGPLNLLVGAGVGLGEVLRAELGVVMDMPQDNIDTNLRIRPMLVLDPPVLPLYGRLIVGVANLLEGDRAFEFGGAVGVGGSVAGVGLFAEVGVLPQAVSGEFLWILEGRAGAFLSF